MRNLSSFVLCILLILKWASAEDPDLYNWVSRFNLQLDTEVYTSLPAVRKKGELKETVIFVHAVFGKFKYKR